MVHALTAWRYEVKVVQCTVKMNWLAGDEFSLRYKLKLWLFVLFVHMFIIYLMTLLQFLGLYSVE
jgi:hypothetical protein